LNRGVAIVRTIVLAALCGGLLDLPGTAVAAAPQIASIFVAEESSTATTIVLRASVNPGGTTTTYAFEYITEGAYESNLAASPPRDPFTGAATAPASGSGSAGSGISPAPVLQELSDLNPATSYRYRLRVMHSGEAPVFSVVRPFSTREPTNAFDLLDHRGWELVSPVDKNGGAIQPPGTIAGGGVFQAAVGGGSVTYSSADSFGQTIQGAPAGSQYIATRGGSGWATLNITTPLLAGSYGSSPDGVPYQLFSGNLEVGLLSNGERCRGGGSLECPVVNPPLSGSGAPPGYRGYYRRSAAGAFESLLTASDLLHTALGPAQFELRLVAATPDLAQTILSSCAALTANATEIGAPGGCDPAAQNLYEWSAGELSLINLDPAASTGTPGAQIATSTGAVSSNGSRVYFTSGGNLYVRDGNATRVVLEGSGAGAFASASGDGSVAYMVNAGQLLKYSLATESLTTIATGPGVEGVLGISADGSKIYYVDSGSVFLRSGGTLTEVASSVLPDNWPPSTGAARVTADGLHLLFLSGAELTGYPNEGQTEVYLYGPPPGGRDAHLTCVSCNPSGERPSGGAAIAGARPNGNDPGALDLYKPRVLSADGNRVFFETTDRLVTRDTNAATPDVYEWEAAGEGTCARPGGCVQLISGGSDSNPSYFLDADEDGGEAFFLTAASLSALDPGSYDIYDARAGGGLPLPEGSPPCVADACQILPAAPEDPTPGTLVANSGNPPLKVTEARGSGGRSEKKNRKHKRHRKHHAQAGPREHRKQHVGNKR
jgi:hypothetical protein